VQHDLLVPELRVRHGGQQAAQVVARRLARQQRAQAAAQRSQVAHGRAACGVTLARRARGPPGRHPGARAAGPLRQHRARAPSWPGRVWWAWGGPREHVQQQARAQLAPPGLLPDAAHDDPTSRPGTATPCKCACEGLGVSAGAPGLWRRHEPQRGRDQHERELGVQRGVGVAALQHQVLQVAAQQRLVVRAQQRQRGRGRQPLARLPSPAPAGLRVCRRPCTPGFPCAEAGGLAPTMLQAHKMPGAAQHTLAMP